MLHVILFATMQINRSLMHGGQRAWKIHFANHFRLAGHVDNDEVVAGDRPQAHRIRWVRFCVQ